MPDSPSQPLLMESIFHPSDFSPASECAFAHALKLALASHSRLYMLHVASGQETDWHDFPGVRETLERWGLIPPGSPREAVGDLGLDVRKVIAESDQPVRACLSFLEKHPADLIVLAVRNHDERMGWLHKHKPVGEPLARHSGRMTLFLPHGIPGFVSRQNGTVTLRNILVPITTKPRPEPALEAVQRLIHHLQVPAGTITLLHVGPETGAPVVNPPAIPGWNWQRVNRPGEPTSMILEAVASLSADLVVMVTDGPDGFLDGLRGTTSERVLREARCPIINIPLEA